MVVGLNMSLMRDHVPCTGTFRSPIPHQFCSALVLEIVAYARVGDGQEVYPSQELILDRGDKKGQKSKTLYVVGDVAGRQLRKIPGNIGAPCQASLPDRQLRKR